MSNTWGALSWNQGNWAGQGDVTAQPTGIAALLSVGASNQVPSNGWGRSTWNDNSGWGIAGTTQAIGSSATLSVGQVQADGIKEVGWGGDAWNINAWGELQPFEQVTGQSLTSSIGNIVSSISFTAGVGGLSLTTTNGGAVAGISQLILPSGQSLQSFIGTEVINIGVPVTGSSATTSVGASTVDPTFLIGEGWGRDTFGNQAW